MCEQKASAPVSHHCLLSDLRASIHKLILAPGMGHESDRPTMPSASEATLDMGSVSGAPGADRGSVNAGSASGVQDGAEMEKGGAGQITTSYPKPCVYYNFIPQTTESYPSPKNGV